MSEGFALARRRAGKQPHAESGTLTNFDPVAIVVACLGNTFRHGSRDTRLDGQDGDALGGVGELCVTARLLLHPDLGGGLGRRLATQV